MTSLSTILEEYLMEASPHGLKKIFLSSPTSSRVTAIVIRVFWLVSWIVAFYLLSLKISNIVNEYRQHPTVTKLTIEQRETVAFPAVTVCAVNPFKKSKVLEWLKNCDQITKENGKLRKICANYAKCVEQETYRWTGEFQQRGICRGGTKPKKCYNRPDTRQLLLRRGGHEGLLQKPRKTK